MQLVYCRSWRCYCSASYACLLTIQSWARTDRLERNWGYNLNSISRIQSAVGCAQLNSNVTEWISSTQHETQGLQTLASSEEVLCIVPPPTLWIPPVFVLPRGSSLEEGRCMPMSSPSAWSSSKNHIFSNGNLLQEKITEDTVLTCRQTALNE
jgi:hypothetical protein